MEGSMNIKCPGCGAYLTYDPANQGFTCPYCDSTFDRSQVKLNPSDAEPDYSGALRSYHCQSCGAELVTGETTAATRCYYCHGPVVLADRLSGAFKPDGLIPFTVTKEQALDAFRKYIAKHRFVDRRFFTDDQLENFTGVYYPYWLGDVVGTATFSGAGTRDHTVTTPHDTIITTRHFQVYRQARLIFRNIVRKGLSTMDRQLSDGIHPYDLKAVRPFDPSYLMGFLAEKRDADQETTRTNILQEVQGYVPGMMEKRGDFTTLRGASLFTTTGMSMRYMLLPCWVLTYKGSKPGSVYYFMMNGQNGKVCGRLPMKKSAVALAAGLAGAAAAALLMLGGAMLW